MKIVEMRIEDLKPAPYNPRVELKPGDPEYEKLKRSIQEFGLVDPVIYNERTGFVIGGHQRLNVLQELGYTAVEVSVVDLPEEKEKALNLALNKISGQWDMPKLLEVLEELRADDMDIEITGFDDCEIDMLIADLKPPREIVEDNFDVDSAVEAIEEPVTRLGDIWQIGRHYLMCGDATVPADVQKLMRGAEAEMIFTDPPYNVNYEGGTGMKLKNDNMKKDAFYQFLKAALINMLGIVAPGGAIYVCHAESEGSNFRGAMHDAGWLLKQTLIWVKHHFVMGRQDYQWRHEPILYGWKPGAAHRWYGGRKQSTVLEDFFTAAGGVVEATEEGAVLRFNHGMSSITLKVPSFEVVDIIAEEGSTIWRFGKPIKNDVHPTMKPIALCARAIQNSSIFGDIVADFFGGSGSTLMAAEQTDRICYAVELDPVFCDVIVQRWEQFTGQKATKITA